MALLNSKAEFVTKNFNKILTADDLSLDGMNAIHLAAKFDPPTLEVCGKQGDQTSL
jgi:hypothetical protein